MNYNLNLDDIFEYKGEDYITLDITEQDGIKYCFTNRLENGKEPSKDFVVFKMLADGIVKEKDIDKLNNVLSIFSVNMNKKLEYLNSLSKEDGE